MSRTSKVLVALALLVLAAGAYSVLRPGSAPEPPPVTVAPDPPLPPGIDFGLEIAVAGAGGEKGVVTIDLMEDVAPAHVARIAALARAGAYDGVVFHRVIDGFMAQTGDVVFGDMTDEAFDLRRAGTGGSDRGVLKAEFSDVPFDRGIVGMARGPSPDSANSQFFIVLDAAYHLNGQYTAVGRVTDGMEVVDAIKRGEGRNGAVQGQPDHMVTVTVTD